MTECPTLPGGGGGGVGLPQQIAYLTVGYTAASRLFSNFGNPLSKRIQVEEKKLFRRRAKFSRTKNSLKGQ
jgi:hypothetical protein